MLILAVESATELAGVALADERGVLATATTSRGRRHAESIAPSVEFVCLRAGKPVRAIEGVCVDVGPGLFTGLRVGVATAKALGFALGVPIVPATSLEVIANGLRGAGAAPGSLLVPVVDARRGEVFCAQFRVSEAVEACAQVGEDGTGEPGDGTGEPGDGTGKPGNDGTCAAGDEGLIQVGGDVLSSPQDLCASLSLIGEPFVLAGDGALRHGELLGKIPGARLAPGALGAPRVEVLAAIGAARLHAGLGVDAAEILPRYLREADARINWQQRLPAREPSRTGI